VITTKRGFWLLAVIAARLVYFQSGPQSMLFIL